MGYPVTLNGRTYTLADFEGQNYVDGLPDAFEDFVTHAGNLYSTTSTTSNSIGTGSKTFTVESSKPYQVGTPLRITDSAAPSTNWMDGIVTAYSGTTLTVDVVSYAGSGTKTSWNINIGGGAVSYTGTLPVAQGGTGATTATAAASNLGVYTKTEADSRFLNVSGEASNVSITGVLTIGTHNQTSETDLVLSGNAVVAADDSITFGTERTTGDILDVRSSLTDKTTGNAGGTSLVTVKVDDTHIYNDGVAHKGFIVNQDGGSANDFRVEVSGNEYGFLVNSANGRVGIGDDAPEAALSVLTDTTTTLSDSQSLIDDTHQGMIKIANTNDTSGAECGLLFRSKLSAAGGFAVINKHTANYASDLIFRSRDASDGVGSQEVMRLRNEGSLMVGGLNSKSTAPTLDRGVFLSSATNNHTIGYSMFINEGTNGRRASLFLDDAAGVVGIDTTASTGVPDIVFRRAGTEMARVNQYGLTFNGDTAAENALDEYEEGTFEMTLLCNAASYNLNARYTKIGNVVTITNASANYWILAPTAAGQSITCTTSLPFTPKVSGGIACSQCRAVRSVDGRDERDGVMPVIGWRAGSTTIYLDATDQEPSYEPSNRLETDGTRTNVVLFFSGSYIATS